MIGKRSIKEIYVETNYKKDDLVLIGQKVYKVTKVYGKEIDVMGSDGTNYVKLLPIEGAIRKLGNNLEWIKILYE